MRFNRCFIAILLTFVGGIQSSSRASHPRSASLSPLAHQNPSGICFLVPLGGSPRSSAATRIKLINRGIDPHSVAVTKSDFQWASAFTQKQPTRHIHPNRILSQKTRLSSTIGNDWTPLYLSSIAGASTCVGAAIVFLLPGEGGRRKVTPDIMTFSLALAGSVMVTVVAISIGPECMHSINASGNEVMIPMFSEMFYQRIASFALGCALYFSLSSAFPEPDEVLISNMNGASYTIVGSGGSQLLRQEELTRFEKWTNGYDLETRDQQKAWRVALLLFISLLFHNFPEGLGKQLLYNSCFSRVE
uniref:Uncharacterized protein n=1 Tax=Ditylum brightwellii TaxID=49249 RepID=A0A7S2EEM6_9STRA|mmetsp:Transcript_27148/g.40309  ORF Transcript_27148/g.40309 Transcript_27148/m.40309 type:complete len:303 (+) Transcript_27148:226-1134(+)